MIVADITIDGKLINIIDMRPREWTQKEWLEDLKYRWADRVTKVEFKNAPNGWARRAHNGMHMGGENGYN